MTFNNFDLDPRILAAVEAVGFKTPTPIQEQAIPLVLDGRDVLGLAQTGTGKTAAFLLPILQRLSKGPTRQTRALIVAPTRELAEQTHQAAVELSTKLKVRSATIYGGVGKGPQISAARRGTEIIVACPGRLLDLLNAGDIDLRNIEVLVLDEADRMCDMGFLPDIRRILKHLPKQRQTLFFSATMPDDIRTLSREILDNPETVQIGMIAPAKTVSHAFYPVPAAKKKSLLMSLMGKISREQEQGERMLVFTRTKHRARNLARDLEKRNYRATALQGNMSQNARQRAIDGFRDGRFDVLVATDIAARGIDVSEISHVINFDIPDTVDAYTHRIGRTGRAKSTGEAFTLVVPDDADMVRDIERTLKMEIERRELTGFDYEGFEPESQFAQKSGQRGGGGNRSGGNRGGSSRGGGNRNGSSRRNGSGGSSNGSRPSGGGQPHRRRRRSSTSNRQSAGASS